MDSTGSPTFPDVPRAELDRTLQDLVRLAGQVLDTQGRLRSLLRANEAVVQQLDLPVVLRRIVEVAVELVGAQYGALGVIASHGGLEQFIHVGMDEQLAERIGHLPEGHGLLGALIDVPQPIRLPHLGADPRSVGFPAFHPGMESFLGVPITVRGEVYGNLYLTNSENGEFSDADEELATALAATAAIAIDNARLFAETKRQRSWAAASAEITSALLSQEEVDAVALLSARVLTLAEADLVFVALKTDNPDLLAIGTARGAGFESIEGRTYPVAGSVAGAVIEGGQPRLVDGDDLPDATAVGADGLGPVMAIPLLAHGGVRGALLVCRATGRRRFTPADLELAADFAGQASVAMELADARSDRQRMLILEDRGRIARDLHDHVIQQLFATGMQLQGVVSRLPAGAIAESVDSSITNIDAAISQIRTAIFALSSSPNTKTDTVRHRIIDVVNELGGAFAQDPHLDFRGAIDIALTGDLGDDVVAVIRESLTNAVKHASADTVSVAVTVHDGSVTVAVDDDGVGIPADRTHSSGLANLASRAERRGGSLRLDSTPGRTSVVWTAPYRRASESS